MNAHPTPIPTPFLTRRSLFGDRFATPLLHAAFTDRYDANQKILNVRRDNDNADSDSTVSEYPDVLDAWVGANEGLVAEWSDLTGNGNHWAQSTAAEQPKAVLHGGPITNAGVGYGDWSGVSLPNVGIKSGWSHSAGVLTATNCTAYNHARLGNELAPDTLLFPPRVTFDISFDATIASGQIGVFFGDNGNGAANLDYITSSGSKSYSATCDASHRQTLFFRSNDPVTALNCTISNIKIIPQVDSIHYGIDFGSLSEPRDLSAGSLSVSGHDLTAFLVWNSDVANAPSQSGADSIFSFSGNQSDTRCYFGQGTSYTSNRMGARWGDTTAYNYNQAAPGDIAVLSFILTETDCDVWMNATQIGNHSITQGVTAPTTRSFRIGGNGSTNLFDGRFYEVIAYDGALSTSDRSDIADFLMDYYSIT
tara:strand:+ start:10292 stop:11557 length:1266 start_codon:yes stop_codon:yes gene_type:complete